MNEFATILKETIERAIEQLLVNGICEPKKIYAICNCISDSYSVELDLVLELFYMILPTVSIK